MRLLFDPAKKRMSEKILAALKELNLAELSSIHIQEIYDLIGEPPKSDMGDFAFGCFTLAKALRKSPADVAKILHSKIAVDSEVKKVEPVGPYLNFTFSESYLGQTYAQNAINGLLYKTSMIDHHPRTMIEYSQPNTHKELHVGHLRNACLGDALVRMLQHVGYPIVRSTFPGDVGTHVAKCLWYLKNHNTEPIPDKDRGEWIGRMYSKGHLKLEDEANTEKYESNKAQLTEILKQLETKQGEYYELWKETRLWSIDLMKEIYRWLDIDFDVWYFESDVDAPSLDYARELYRQGKLVESQGAIGMDLSADNLGFCMLIKSDGTGLYSTKDVELAKRKFLDFKIDRSLYVVDTRQALHFQQVFKVLERLGFEQSKDCYHLQYNFVELPDGVISSRKGNIVPVIDLIHQMENKIKTDYLQRYVSEWSQDEINLVAEQVAKGAIKYGMLRIDPNKKIVFDMAEWLKIDGESGPFVQYSVARIKSLVRKFPVPVGVPLRFELLTHPSERQLLQSLARFQTVVLNSAESYKPSTICTFVYETAKKFNLFYHECSIGNAESEELKHARLALSQAVGTMMEKGLSILGIPAPSRM